MNQFQYRPYSHPSNMSLSNMQDTYQLAHLLSQYVLNHHTICFDGPVGIGKSTLIKNIMQILGMEYKGSPTYGMANEYQLYRDNDIAMNIVHIDFYQSSSIDILAYDRHIALVEWSSLRPKAMLFFTNIIYVSLDWQGAYRHVQLKVNG